MNAVIKVGGKQYFVKENDVIFVEKLNAEDLKSEIFNLVQMQKQEIK